MFRSLVVLVVALGALAQAPAAATPGPSGPGEVHPEWGSTAGQDARIKKGCRGYRYDYAITPPDGYWSLETFLIGPSGKQHASGYFLTGHDPLAGPGEFRLCRRNVERGRYTIRARVTVGDDSTSYTTGWLPDSSFRIRPKRH